jgi:hypothetical protein
MAATKSRDGSTWHGFGFRTPTKVSPINSATAAARPPRGMTFCPDCRALVSKTAYRCPRCDRVVKPLGLTMLRVVLCLAATTFAAGAVLWAVAAGAR